MALAFPASPATGEIFTNGTRSWRWSGARWQSLPPDLGITTTTHTASGNTDTFSASGLVSSNPSHCIVTLNGVVQAPGLDYSVSLATGKIIFLGSYPAAGTLVVITALGIRPVVQPLRPGDYTTAFDSSSDGLTTYTGKLLNSDLPAAPALPESATAWKITRSTFNAAGRLITTARATGSWANKESLSYQ